MKWLRHRGARIALDLGLLIGFGAEFITREGPDYAVHSWIGIVLIPVVAIHLTTNWNWVTSTFRRRAAHPEWSLAQLNTVLMLVTVICIVTGFPLWLEWSDSDLWSITHTVTGFVSIILALSHLWRNRSRLKRLLARRNTTPSVAA